MRYSVRTLTFLGVSSIGLLTFVACSSSSGGTAGEDAGHEDAGSDVSTPTKDAGKDTGTKDATHDTGKPGSGSGSHVGSGSGSGSEVGSGSGSGSEVGSGSGSSSGSGAVGSGSGSAHGSGSGSTSGSGSGSGSAHGSGSGSSSGSGSGSGSAHGSGSGSGSGSGAGTSVANYFMGRWDQSAVLATHNATGDGTWIGSVARWPGSGVITTFTGTNITLTLLETCNLSTQCDNVTVEIDGAPVIVAVINGTTVTNAATDYSFALHTGSNTIEVTSTTAPSIATGTHTIGVFKNTDSYYGGSYIFNGWTPASGNPANLIKASYTFAHHIEWIGDDLSNGRGAGPLATTATVAECSSANGYGTDPANGITNLMSSEYSAYPAIISKALNAERYNLSISNAGVYEANLGGVPIPNVYTTTNPDGSGGNWTFTKWTPELVVVNLGSYGDFPFDGEGFNDNPGFASEQTFIGHYNAAYSALLTTIRSKYASAKILVVAGNAYPGNINGNNGNLLVHGAYSYYLGHSTGETAGTTIAFFDTGLGSTYTCGYYPSAADQTCMATTATSAGCGTGTGIEGEIKTLMGW